MKIKITFLFISLAKMRLVLSSINMDVRKWALTHTAIERETDSFSRMTM